MYKTIVVQVDDSAAMESRLQAAASLANAHGAHLVGSAATGTSWPAYALLTGSMAVTPVDEFDAMCVNARKGLHEFAERGRQLGVDGAGRQQGQGGGNDAVHELPFKSSM